MIENPWKESIQVYFREFMEFFFSKEAKEIDFDADAEFLDKEFEKIVAESESGKRLADVLARVWLHSGDEKMILIHVEVQGYQERRFAERMYIYNYRIFDRYDLDVASFALLTDRSVKFRPGEYKRKFGRFELNFRFPMAKLIDYKNREKSLKKNDNPFAVLTRAYLQEIDRSGTYDEKMLGKVSLIKELYKKGLDRQDILQLYKFIDWIITLPEGLKSRFHEEIIKIEEEEKMPYITTAEQIGIEKGIQQGIQQGMVMDAQEMVIDALAERFGILRTELIKRIKAISSREILKELLRLGIRAKTLEEFQEILNDFELD